MRENKEDTKNRRLFDITIPTKMGEIKQELKDFKDEMYRKLDNGITSKLDKMIEKVMSLQCNVHIEKIDNIEKNTKRDVDNIDIKVNGLYVAFAVIFLAEIATIVITIMKIKGG